jgi:hypothetical protein
MGARVGSDVTVLTSRTRPSQNYAVNVQISQATSDHAMTTITTARAAPKA